MGAKVMWDGSPPIHGRERGFLMSTLRSNLIRLASANPELRPHLLPLLKEGMEHASPEALQKYLKDHPGADKSKHSVKKQTEEDEESDLDALHDWTDENSEDLAEENFDQMEPDDEDE